MKADLPDNELERLDALYSYNILDTLPEEVFDNFTLIASTICQVPISIIGFMDKDRQWYKSTYGLNLDIIEVPRDISFCSHALLENKITVVPDTRLDKRFFDSPMINEDPKVKFYASIPLIIKDKFAIGTLCVMDSVPRDLTDQQIKSLEALSKQIISQIEQRTYSNELEKTKKQLEYERNRLDDLFTNAPEFIALLQGPEHRFLLANSAYKQVIGKYDLIGKSYIEILPEIEEQGFIKILDEVYKTGEPFIGKEILVKLNRNNDGKLAECYFNFTYQPVVNIDKEIEGISIFGFEITNQVLARQKIEKLYKELSISKDKYKQLSESLEIEVKKRTRDLEISNDELKSFAYIASHDLQEPLRSITSYSELLFRRYKDKLDENADDYIASIIKASKRMKFLIEDILNHSNIYQKLNNRVSVNLNNVIDDVKNLLASDIEENNAVIEYADLPTVKAEYTHMIRLFQSLISNSIKYRKKDVNPLINISIKYHEKYWLVIIKDNGIGINDKYKYKVFEIFQRLHNRDEYEGTGIGLASCKKIVELYGGNIWVESEENIDSTFYFTLPY